MRGILNLGRGMSMAAWQRLASAFSEDCAEGTWEDGVRHGAAEGRNRRGEEPEITVLSRTKNRRRANVRRVNGVRVFWKGTFISGAQLDLV